MGNLKFEQNYLSKSVGQRKEIIDKMQAYKDEFLPDNLYNGLPAHQDITSNLDFAIDNLNTETVVVKVTPKTRKVRVKTERIAKYNYPEGMTPEEKRKYRAKMRREFKVIISED